MKKFSEYEFARFIPLSIIVTAEAAAISLSAGHPDLSFVFNTVHLFTLTVSILCINLFAAFKNPGLRFAVQALFFFINAFYVFTAGVVCLLFRSELSPGLVLYFVENAGMLFTDTVEVLRSMPAGFYTALLLAMAAGGVVLGGRADRVIRKIFHDKISTVIYTAVFILGFSVIKISGFLAEQPHEAGTFRGVDFSAAARNKQYGTHGFRERYGCNVQPGTDIVFIILEGVSAEYFDSSASGCLEARVDAVRAEKFFVPTPHTTMSIYSLLTGNYGNYRSRQRATPADVSDSLPAFLRRRGYSTYFLYSGPTYFEGLHEMLDAFGLTVINKESLEKLTDPRTGKAYRSFNWGVDDYSLAEAAAGILSRASGPSLFFIGLSSTHSPYFNPYPDRFCRFDNSTTEGRYRNSIDYGVWVIDRLIETFMRSNRDTLFIILSDHGESFGQEGYSRHSFSLYNTEISVPLIMLHSSFGKGSSPFSGSVIDLYPSLMDMMGLDLPSPVEGRSFFSPGYSLRLFLSSWREGESKGLLLGGRKWIYSRREGTLYEMDTGDSARIDLSSDPGKSSFVKFLNRQY